MRETIDLTMAGIGAVVVPYLGVVAWRGWQRAKNLKRDREVRRIIAAQMANERRQLNKFVQTRGR